MPKIYKNEKYISQVLTGYIVLTVMKLLLDIAY